MSEFYKKYRKHFEEFYRSRAERAQQGLWQESQLRDDFIYLLKQIGKSYRNWNLVPELPLDDRRVRPDATLVHNSIPRGYYEAKDIRDDLALAIKRKFEIGYPKTNIIFEDTRQAVLYQNGNQVASASLSPEQKHRHAFAELLRQFFEYTDPTLERYDQALAAFKERVPHLAKALATTLQKAHKAQPRFQEAFKELHQTCKDSIDPNISVEQVDEMLIEHLLTERLITEIFSRDFTSRNIIAAQIEKVIEALVSPAFDRNAYLQELSYIFDPIISAARGLNFWQNQQILNEVYERFFQGYSEATADTHGIVYTPQDIVTFMCQSVLDALQDHFGIGLDDPSVVIVDPCTGTGSFIVSLLKMSGLAGEQLRGLYEQRLFANEVLLMPYYIASLNIERAFYDLYGGYAAFEGMCFVDTLRTFQAAQLRMFNEKNTQRIARQLAAPINVI
ncbi:MAG: DNA helicase, partial [Candidatus Thermofonsia Clade 1 bacterium]